MKLSKLPLRDEDDNYHVVIETPRGSLVKLNYDVELGAIKFGRPMPLGVSYPYDWGFFPSTLAEDGDPLDAMVLFDCPTYPGCIIPSLPIGVVELTQDREEGSGRERNDRVICVPSADPRVGHVHDLPKRVREELEQFFVSSTFKTGKNVRVEGWGSPKDAKASIERAATTCAKSRAAKTD